MLPRVGGCGIEVYSATSIIQTLFYIWNLNYPD